MWSKVVGKNLSMAGFSQQQHIQIMASVGHYKVLGDGCSLNILNLKLSVEII